MENNQFPTLADINDARRMIAGSAIRTPLVRLNSREAPAEIYLKLENLQPIGSFKIRGATNAMGHLSPETLSRGVLTASAGNMAQGVAWRARELGIPCTVVAPDTAPDTRSKQSNDSAEVSSRSPLKIGGAHLKRVHFLVWKERSFMRLTI